MIQQHCIDSYRKLKNLKLVGDDLGIPWQTVYVHLRRAGEPVTGDKARYGNAKDRLASFAERRAALSENKHLRAEIAAILEKVDVMSNYIGELHSAAFNAALDAMAEDAERMGLEY